MNYDTSQTENKKYLVRVSDKIKGVFSELSGNNKEVVLRNAAKIAKESKTQFHWKNKIIVYVNLYKKEEIQKDKCATAIKTMKF